MSKYALHMVTRGWCQCLSVTYDIQFPCAILPKVSIWIWCNASYNCGSNIAVIFPSALSVLPTSLLLVSGGMLPVVAPIISIWKATNDISADGSSGRWRKYYTNTINWLENTKMNWKWQISQMRTWKFPLFPSHDDSKKCTHSEHDLKKYLSQNDILEFWIDAAFITREVFIYSLFYEQGKYDTCLLFSRNDKFICTCL